MALRKELADHGLDCGAATICYHLQKRHRGQAPSEATIWRALVRRGFVVPQPQKRPKSSLRRFEAEAPNELWQIDATQWVLGDGDIVEIINVLDDHSRLAVASRAVPTTTSALAWDAFWAAGERWGVPRGCLSDNGLAFSGRLRGVEVVFERQLRARGIRPITSRPYHPQTCGKVERFQQTLKRWLAAQGPFETIEALQEALDRFCRYHNEVRPHRAIGRVPPLLRWSANPAVTTEGTPLGEPIRRTHVVVDTRGVAEARPYRFAVGVEYEGKQAEVVFDATHAAIYVDGVLVRSAELDHSRLYQPSGRRRGGRRRQRLA